MRPQPQHAQRRRFITGNLHEQSCFPMLKEIRLNYHCQNLKASASVETGDSGDESRKLPLALASALKFRQMVIGCPFSRWFQTPADLSSAITQPKFLLGVNENSSLLRLQIRHAAQFKDVALVHAFAISKSTSQWHGSPSLHQQARFLSLSSCRILGMYSYLSTKMPYIFTASFAVCGE